MGKYEEYQRKSLEPIVNYIESVMASYSKEELEARIKKALPEKESEDERIRKMLVEQMERWKKCAEDNNVEQDVKEASAAIAYLEKQKEQKPAEYPEKGNEYWFGFNEGKGTVLDNPEQFGLHRPAEWSEKEQKMIDLIIAIFKVNHPNGHFKANELGDHDMRVVCSEEIVSWLKSLRPQPHWKPSKEQINALQAFVGMIHPDARYNAVSSLLDELKAL